MLPAGWATKGSQGEDRAICQLNTEALAQERVLSSLMPSRQPPGSSAQKENLSLSDFKSL